MHMRFRALAVAILFGTTGMPAAADWFGAIESGVIYDDNLSRSERSADARSDRALRLVAEGGRHLYPTGVDALRFSGSLEYTLFDRMRGMRNLVADLSASWRRRFGLGTMAPALHATASVQRLQFNESIRDGWFLPAELRWIRPLNERWDMQVAALSEIRRGDASGPSTVFDQKRFGAALAGSAALGQQWFLGIGYAWLNGDVDSNATPNQRIIDASRALVVDPAFGQGRTVYRLKADVHSLSFDLSRALGRQASLIVDYELQLVRARGGIDYERNRLRVGYVHLF